MAASRARFPPLSLHEHLCMCVFSFYSLISIDGLDVFARNVNSDQWTGRLCKKPFKHENLSADASTGTQTQFVTSFEITYSCNLDTQP